MLVVSCLLVVLFEALLVVLCEALLVVYIGLWLIIWLWALGLGFDSLSADWICLIRALMDLFDFFLIILLSAD